MCRQIRRRDPTRPGLWYLSHMAPHPPLVPPQRYLDMYRDVEIPEPVIGEWAQDPDSMPPSLRRNRANNALLYGPRQRTLALRAFYALCTHIDHQLRLVLGTLREEGLLDNTVIMFTADHGDMLGDHGLWAKRQFLEGSANVPMIVLGARQSPVTVAANAVDDRIVGWQDVMPSLLECCDIAVPDSVEGRSMFSAEPRSHLYAEIDEGPKATRMIRDQRHKLIYFSEGNVSLLFDLEKDPHETVNCAADPAYQAVLDRLSASLIAELYGGDEEWVRDGALVGLPAGPVVPATGSRALNGQRGIHHPMPLRD